MIKIVVLFGTILISLTAFSKQPMRPFTPGALCSEQDPDFMGYRYQARVAYCKRNVSHAKKLKIARAYGIPESEWKNYEFDHLIPLNAGGSSRVENLWPEPIDEARSKDQVEKRTFEGLSRGTLTQDEAVQMIWDWVALH